MKSSSLDWCFFKQHEQHKSEKKCIVTLIDTKQYSLLQEWWSTWIPPKEHRTSQQTSLLKIIKYPFNKTDYIHKTRARMLTEWCTWYMNPLPLPRRKVSDDSVRACMCAHSVKTCPPSAAVAPARGFAPWQGRPWAPACWGQLCSSEGLGETTDIWTD